MRLLQAIKIYNEFKALEREVSTIHGYDLDLRQLCLYLRNPFITQITPDQIVEYVNMMKEYGWKQNSILVKCTAYAGFFKFWKKKGYPVLDPDLIPHVKRTYTQPKVAELEDLKKLFGACRETPSDIRTKSLLMLLLDSGARIGELLSLNIDIDVETHQDGMYSAIILTEKSRGQKPVRRIYWYEETNNALKKWLAIRKTLTYCKDNALFVGVESKGSTHNAGKRLESGRMAAILRRLSKRAKLSYAFNCHSLRHKFGNDLAHNGANNSIISDLMGHASLSSSFVYTHLNDSQARVAHKQFRKR